jgi:hypothetical protein
MGVYLALVGCGSAPPDSSPETQWDNEQSGPHPDRDMADPSSAPGGDSPLDGRTRSPLEAEASLPASACIPWTYSAPPVRAAACASEAVFADGTSQRARYDADSHPLEVRTFTASGELTRVDTQVWRDGLQRLQRAERPSGYSEQTEWTYNAQAQLERRLTTVFVGQASTYSYDFTYDAQGRISQVVHQTSYGDDTTSHYTYDAAGHLVSIDNGGYDCGHAEDRCETLSYWPNGSL